MAGRASVTHIAKTERHDPAIPEDDGLAVERATILHFDQVFVFEEIREQAVMARCLSQPAPGTRVRRKDPSSGSQPIPPPLSRIVYYASAL
jgi:hypothetical protein